MNNKQNERSKWGPMFDGQPMVPLYIPPDPLNPSASRWMSINGQEILLAVGEQLTVPASVRDAWENSARSAAAANSMMRQVVEIGA